MAAVVGLFDDVSYPAAGLVSSYRNGAGVSSLGTSARVVFNAFNPGQSATATVVVNGRSHTFAPYSSASRSVAGSVAIPVSDLVIGNNTITFAGGLGPVANIDLVIESPS
jgi:hypothetical protein